MSSVSKSSVTVCSSSTISLSSSVHHLPKFQFRWRRDRTDFHFRYPWQFRLFRFFKNLLPQFFLRHSEKKIFRIWFLNEWLSPKIIFSQWRGNHKLKKVHVAFFQNLQFLKNANFETVSDSDFIFCTMQNEGYGETSPSSDFIILLYIQNLCLHIPHILH